MFGKAKGYAETQGITLGELIRRAVEEYVRKVNP